MQIGSIFELDLKALNPNKTGNGEEAINHFDYAYQKLFNTGRSAIKYLFKTDVSIEKDEKILVPAYLCTSILEALEQVGVNYIFYNVDENLHIDIEDLQRKVDDKTKAIFFIQYFGFAQPQELLEILMSLSKKGILLIEDLTQSMFSSEGYLGIGDYAIASIRKWFAIPDGAVLWSKTPIQEYDIKDGYSGFTTQFLLAQILKYKYHQNEGKEEKIYRDYISKAEGYLEEDKQIREISDVAQMLIENYDYQLLLRRRENFGILAEGLKEIKEVKLLYSLTSHNIPLGCPIIVEHKSALIRCLMEHEVYCPTHWVLSEEIYNNYPHLKKVCESILTIPCDQRYTEGDMKRVIRVITDFYNTNNTRLEEVE